MSRNSVILGSLVLIAAAAGLVYLGWSMLAYEEAVVCAACKRVVHEEARVVAKIGGKETSFCCPSCALAEGRQTGEAVEIVELTDYPTHGPLSAEDAFLVVGSSVNHCLRGHGPQTVFDESKAVTRLDFDRCSPSVITFADETQAQQFMAANGGRMMSFDELAKAFQ